MHQKLISILESAQLILGKLYIVPDYARALYNNLAVTDYARIFTHIDNKTLILHTFKTKILQYLNEQN